MKKHIAIIAISLSIAMLAACSVNTESSDHIENSTPTNSILDNSSDLDLSTANRDSNTIESSDNGILDKTPTQQVDIALVPVKHIDWGEIFDTTVSGSFNITDRLGEYYLGEKSSFNYSSGTLDYDELLISSDSTEEISLKYPDDFPEWTLGSGSYIILENQYLYEWRSYTTEFGSDNLHDMKLTRIDGNTGVVEVVDEIESESPFIYLVKINDDSFLSYCNTKAPSDVTAYATLTTTSIYYSDGTNKEIIREIYENDASWSDSTGILLENFAVKDGEIYGFGRRRISDEYKLFLYHYDNNGKLLETKELLGLENIIGSEQAIELFLVGDYIIFRTAGSLTRYICKITEQGVVLITKGSHYAVSDSMIFFIESNVDSSTDTIKEKDIPLYSIDVASDEVSAVDFEVPLKQPYFISLKALSNGDLAFRYCKNGVYDPTNYVQYVLPINEVNALIKADR